MPYQNGSTTRVARLRQAYQYNNVVPLLGPGRRRCSYAKCVSIQLAKYLPERKIFRIETTEKDAHNSSQIHFFFVSLTGFEIIKHKVTCTFSNICSPIQQKHRFFEDLLFTTISRNLFLPNNEYIGLRVHKKDKLKRNLMHC